MHCLCTKLILITVRQASHQYRAGMREHPHEWIQAIRNLVRENCGREGLVVGQPLGRNIVDLPRGVLKIRSVAATRHQAATHDDDVPRREGQQGWVPPAVAYNVLASWGDT